MKRCIVLLNTPTVGMPIYDHPHAVSLTSYFDGLQTIAPQLPPGKHQLTTCIKCMLLNKRLKWYSKIALSPGEGSGPPCNTWLQGPPHSTSQTPSQSIQPSFRRRRFMLPYYFTMGQPLPQHKTAPSPGGIWTPIQNMFTAAQPTPHAKWHLDQTARYCRIPVRCAHRQIHRQTTPQVSSNMPHLQRVQKNGTSILSVSYTHLTLPTNREV